MTIDWQECFQKGCIGAFGAIPGTVAAHPLDLTKIRLQLSTMTTTTTTTATSATSTPHSSFHFFRAAAQQTWQNPTAGLGSAVQQKVLTRGPMFLASAACTQLIQDHAPTTWSRTVSVTAGSWVSGFLTGCIASPAEWAKVQQGIMQQQQQQQSKQQQSALRLVSSSIRHGNTLSLLRRIRGAGLRNGIFDATFFGTEHSLQQLGGTGTGTTGWPQSQSVRFALAAVAAVIVDYPVDAAVKRSMAVGSHQVVAYGPLQATYRFVVHDCQLSLTRVYRGLSCKGLEFAVSYFCTGAVAPWVVAGFAAATAAAVAQD